MHIDKDNSMLLDIQYIKADKKNNTPDYLYCIYKDLRTNKKFLQAIPEPMMKIYFKKPEYRGYTHNPSFSPLEELETKVVKYKDIIYKIAKDMGPSGQQKLNDCFNTRNYRGLKEFLTYPYVFGADFDIRGWYRHKWLANYDNDKIKHITKGFLDIEVDIMETGEPNPYINPVDLVTVIDWTSKKSYTFSLIGVDYTEKDLSKMNEYEKKEELEKKELYKQRLEQQEYWSTHVDELLEETHKAFDELYPDMEYRFYFYKDERKMLVHLFQLINELKLDFIGIWNMPFDIPFLIERMTVLGLDPKQIMTHPDFPIKQCWFKKDEHNFAVKLKSDYFYLSSYTLFFDQMVLYAAIRKGSSELRQYKLNYIAKREIGDEKYDYSEEGNIKTLSYKNFLKYILYNIKDVLLQCGIEDKTGDVDTYYLTSYKNATPYESIFKQIAKLRNVQYMSYYDQGLIPGENVNGFLYNNKNNEVENDDDDEPTFEGALVGNPLLIEPFGVELFGKKSSLIFLYSIDFDMKAFYPCTMRELNIDQSTLIFKMILEATQYDVRGGELKFNGITDVQLVDENEDSFVDDVAKELMDNYQTGDIIYTAHKWLNYPSIEEVYKKLRKKLEE